MAEQPGIVERVLARGEELADAILSKGLFPARGIILVARGSSDNAAVYARYLLELALQSLHQTQAGSVPAAPRLIKCQQIRQQRE